MPCQPRHRVVVEALPVVRDLKRKLRVRVCGDGQWVVGALDDPELAVAPTSALRPQLGVHAVVLKDQKALEQGDSPGEFAPLLNLNERVVLVASQRDVF